MIVRHYIYFLFLILSRIPKKNNAFRVFEVNGVSTILAIENEHVTFECKKDIQMSYCAFVHPNGSRFSFKGLELNAGHCSIKMEVTKRDNGEWRCHIGQKAAGVEIIQKKYVRVANRLAAVKPNVFSVHGKEVTLMCATTQRMLPLSYCRFEPPKEDPFSINLAVNVENPIMGRYYFPQNLSLDRGDCAVTINKIKYEDVGLWTCGAGLEDGKEYTDVITVDVEGLYTMSTASASGITVGAVIVVILLALLVFVTWKKHSLLGTRQTHGNEGGVETHELTPVQPTSRTPRQSPQSRRSVPSVVVQSPSEPSVSLIAST